MTSVRERVGSGLRPRRVAWRSRRRGRRAAEGHGVRRCSATAPARRRSSASVLCPGYPGLHRPGQPRAASRASRSGSIEIDHEYKVPPAIEAYERHKKEGAVLDGIYGTPQTAALNQKLNEDKIPGTSPGFGTAAAANGKRYPYIFPIARDLLVAGRARRSSSPRTSWAAASRARRSPTCSTTTRPARSRCRSSRSCEERGLRDAHLRGAAARRRDGRAGARHRAALPARFRDRAPVRPLAVGRDQGAEAAGYPAVARWSASSGPRPRPTSRRPAAGRGRGLLHACSSPASATTIRC